MSFFPLIAVLLAGAPTGITAAAVAVAPAPTLAIESTLVLNVADGRPAGDALVAKVETLGGYFAERHDLSLQLKVPVDQAATLLAFAESLGTILRRDHRAIDLQATLQQQRTRVKSKQTMLAQYMKVLQKANARAIVSVERQVTALVAEIEQLRGAIKVLEHRLQMALVRISFRLQKRETPVASGNSPFPWLNTVNLVDLYQDFINVPH